MARADEALYAAKQAGRDRVIVKNQPALSVVRFRA
jgi:PleD family two-component response regulator